MTTRQLEYKEYLRSDHWKALRKQALERDKHCCQRCPARDLELHVHHLFYRDNFYDTRLEDVLTICFLCHRIEHPEHYPDIKVFFNLDQLRDARSKKLITKREFKAWLKRLGLWKKPVPKQKKRKKVKKPRKMKPYPIYYYTRSSKPRWVSRGSSSN